MRRFMGRREEQLLAVDAIGGDGVEAGLRRQPLVPDLRVGEFDLRPFGGIDQNAAVG